MEAIKNFVQFINDNWTLITAILAALAGIYAKFTAWRKKTKKQKIDSAIEAVRVSLLGLVTEAEQAYGAGTGAIKRSHVYARIFEEHPVLAEALELDKLVDMLDGMLDENLAELNKTLADNEAFRDMVYSTLDLSVVGELVSPAEGETENGGR